MRIITNTDKEHVKKIREAIKNNNGYCCCSLIRNESTRCMCKEFRNMIENKELVECHCGLYQIVEKRLKADENLD